MFRCGWVHRNGFGKLSNGGWWKNVTHYDIEFRWCVNTYIHPLHMHTYEFIQYTYMCTCKALKGNPMVEKRRLLWKWEIEKVQGEAQKRWHTNNMSLIIEFLCSLWWSCHTDNLLLFNSIIREFCIWSDMEAIEAISHCRRVNMLFVDCITFSFCCFLNT